MPPQQSVSRVTKVSSMFSTVNFASLHRRMPKKWLRPERCLSAHEDVVLTGLPSALATRRGRANEQVVVVRTIPHETI